MRKRKGILKWFTDEMLSLYYERGNMKLIKKRIFIVGIMILLTGCAVKEEDQPIIDNSCNHEWVEVEWDWDTVGSIIYYDLYCPKCKSEQTVTSKEWKKIQADQEYEQIKE